MKLILTYISFFLFLFVGYSQQSIPCLFDQITNKEALKDIERLFQSEAFSESDGSRNTDSIKVVPVVVHVIHNGGSENISEAQIQSQIQILNEDFGKLPNTNGEGNGVDTRVRFFLANLNPDGQCTNGIVRIKSPLTNHQSYQRALLKELSFWDNNRYFNIYIVKSINGNVAGYASFPGGPPDEDGVVVQHTFFGNTGTAGSFAGRTATHEAGHWLGLYHTFNNACGTDLCTDGDYVCDTPPAFEPNYACITVNTCNNDSPDLDDLKENYMDYTPGTCKNMFTEGQKMRIQTSLNSFRSEIWSDENLLATGYDSIYITPDICPVVADFISLTRDICIDNSVYFSDISLNNVSSWQWSFPGGIPDYSTEQNPTIVYNTVGNYGVSLIVFGENNTDTLTIEDYIVVNTPGAGAVLPYSENFDSGLYPPENITLNNPDGGITWELDSLASVSGNYSMRISNLENTNYGTVDEILLPELDLSSVSGNLVYMSFKWAYARSDPSFSDQLLVLLSTDCGSTYAQVFYRSGNGLATGPTQTTYFVPDSTQWRDAFIILNNFNSDNFVQIKIVNVTDGGNNLYIDDLYIGDGNDPVATGNVNDETLSYTIFPNPVSNQLNIEVQLTRPQNLSLRLYNAQGREIRLLHYAKGQHHITFSVESLPNGIYTMLLDTGVFQKLTKFVVQH